MSRTENLKYLDVPVFMLVTVLVLFGTIMIGSANGWVYSSEHFTLDSLMIKQLIGYGLGLFVIVLIMICDYSFLKLMAVPAYCAVLVLLLLVLKYGVGAEENDNVSRWLPLFGDINIQPSELCKISLTLMLAWFFERYQNSINRIHVLFFALVLSMIPLYLVFKEPDLSTSMVLLAIVGSSLFSTRLSWKYIIPGVLLASALIIIVYFDAISEAPKLLGAYQVDRILAWLNPEEYALTTAYQTIQSRTAIGSGALYGVGIFQNSGMVPVPTTDFIFGIIGEELGFIGSSVVIILFMSLSLRILWIAAHTEDIFGRIVCIGIAIMIAFQSAIHMGVSTAVLPNTGLPLPFVSYGLSSLTANMLGIGLVLRINAENRKLKLRRYGV